MEVAFPRGEGEENVYPEEPAHLYYNGVLSLVALASLSASPSPTLEGLPSAFVANRGQYDARVRYQASIPGGTAFLTDRGLTVDLHGREKGHVFTLSIGKQGSLQPLEKTDEERSFFLGDESHWARKVPTYRRVVRRGVAEGVDMVHTFEGDRLRYDLVVAPGANPDAIRMKVSGAKARVSPDGKTVTLDTVLGPIQLQKLFAYQGDRAVPCRFDTRPDGTLGFKLGAYDRSKPLTIDPIVWSRYIDGYDEDELVGVVPKGIGYYTVSNVSVNPFSDSDGGYQVANAGQRDIVVSRHNGLGIRIASTYFGGQSTERSCGIAIDAQGAVRIAGSTLSTNLPTKKGAYRRRLQGSSDLFAATLTSDLSDLVSGTYLGGTDDEGIDFAAEVSQEANTCAIDANGDTVVAGWTESTDAYVSGSALQKFNHGFRDIYLVKVAKDGTKVDYATLFGAGRDEHPHTMFVGPDGTTTVTGVTYSDNFPTTKGVLQPKDRADADGSGFVFRLRPNNTLAFSTYFNANAETRVYDLDVNAKGEIVLGGKTSGRIANLAGAFNRPAGDTDGFVVKLSKDATTLLGGTFIGGAAYDAVYRVRFDAAGNLCAIGETDSVDLPTGNPGVETDFPSRAASNSGFLARFSPDAKVARYVSYLGANNAVYPRTLLPLSDGTWIVGGRTFASDFPTVPAGNSTAKTWVDSWLTKIAPGTVIKSVTSSDVRSGGTSTVRVTLNKKAVADITVRLSDTDPATDLISKRVVVKKGTTSVETEIKVGTVDAAKRVTLVATYDASTVTGTLQIDP